MIEFQLSRTFGGPMTRQLASFYVYLTTLSGRSVTSLAITRLPSAVNRQPHPCTVLLIHAASGKGERRTRERLDFQADDGTRPSSELRLVTARDRHKNSDADACRTSRKCKNPLVRKSSEFSRPVGYPSVQGDDASTASSQ